MRKQKKILKLNCENPKCKPENIMTKKTLDETDVFFLVSKINWDNLPKVVRKLSEKLKVFFVTKMLTDDFDLYQCNVCDYFKLIKKKEFKKC